MSWPSHGRYGPVRHYQVVFWRQPVVGREDRAGMPQSRVVWAADENEVVDVRDVVEVLEWAKAEAHVRQAIFTIYAVVDQGRHMTMVWLAGWDPTIGGPDNYANRQRQM